MVTSAIPSDHRSRSLDHLITDHHHTHRYTSLSLLVLQAMNSVEHVKFFIECITGTRGNVYLVVKCFKSKVSCCDLVARNLNLKK